MMLRCPDCLRRPLRGSLALFLLLVLCAGAADSAGAAQAARHPGAALRSRSPYPAAASRPSFIPRRSEFASQAKPAAGRTTATRGRPRKKPRKPALSGNPLRALLAFQAMQRYYYIQGSGLYSGEPFSYLWPFSQALAANVTLANVLRMPPSVASELRARLVGLRSYLDTNNSGLPEGTFTSTLAAFDGTVAPPAGPGGTKYYDDNDWVGIELMRIYKLTHEPAALGSAEAIMAFEMAGWQTNPQLPCPGGIPFSNNAENTDRNTVTNAPAAELAVQLYRATANVQYLRFAEMAYEWVRGCLLQPSGLYADHINAHGAVEQTLWSYGQGTMIGAGTLLYQATGNAAYLYQARQTAKAALAYFTPERLGSEIPFFPSVYFRNVLYLDSVTHDPPGAKLAQSYVDYAWQHLRLSNNLFVAGSPAAAQLLVQAAIVQIYGLLSSPAASYF
jgi:Glycosyl hydrolase family 76